MVSKIKSMRRHVETPLKETFAGRVGFLGNLVDRPDGRGMSWEFGSADMALSFQALPKVPVVLVLWDA